jgi:hypothetical protein
MFRSFKADTYKSELLVTEAKAMIGGAKKCKQIWTAIRKVDFRDEGLLNETNVILVFRTCHKQIYDLMRLKTPGEFMKVFDNGGDGLLNEDE